MSNQQKVFSLSGIIHNVHKKPTSTGRCMAVFTMGGKHCKCFGELAEHILQSEGEYAEIEATAGTYRGQTEYALVSVRATVKGRQVSIKDSRSVPKPQATGAKKPDVDGGSGQILSDTEINMIQEEIVGLFQSFARRHVNDRDLFEKILTDTRMPGISLRAITDVLAHADANAAKCSSGTSNTPADAEASAAAEHPICPKESADQITAGAMGESSTAVTANSSTSPMLLVSNDEANWEQEKNQAKSAAEKEAARQTRLKEWREYREAKRLAKEQEDYEHALKSYGYEDDYFLRARKMAHNVTAAQIRAIDEILEKRKAAYRSDLTEMSGQTAGVPVAQSVV
jgi:hypothetical protein